MSTCCSFCPSVLSSGVVPTSSSSAATLAAAGVASAPGWTQTPRGWIAGLPHDALNRFFVVGMEVDELVAAAGLWEFRDKRANALDYGNARLRAMRSRLLSAADYDGLVATDETRFEQAEDRWIAVCTGLALHPDFLTY